MNSLISTPHMHGVSLSLYAFPLIFNLSSKKMILSKNPCLISIPVFLFINFFLDFIKSCFHQNIIDVILMWLYTPQKNDSSNSKDGTVTWCLIIYSKEWRVEIPRLRRVKEQGTKIYKGKIYRTSNKDLQNKEHRFTEQGTQI